MNNTHPYSVHVLIDHTVHLVCMCMCVCVSVRALMCARACHIAGLTFRVG